MSQEDRESALPSSAEVEAELNRELRKRRTWMLMRCALYILVTLAVIAVFVLFTLAERDAL